MKANSKKSCSMNVKKAMATPKNSGAAKQKCSKKTASKKCRSK